jgi:nucleoside-triphosphatase THEP1
VSLSRVILLTGPVGAGKSRLVEALAHETGCRSGFVQRGLFDEHGRKIGYDLVGLATGLVRPLARLSAAGDGWAFDDAAFEAALAEIRDGSDLAIIDEIGPLELAGKGHARALDLALGSSKAVLCVVREELAAEVHGALLARAKVTAVPFAPGREREVAAAILERIRPRRRSRPRP